MTATSSIIMHKMAGVVQEAAKLVRKDFREYAADARCEISNKSERANLPDFVTKTDHASEAIIRAGLEKAFPDIPFVGEECGGSYDQEKYFLVDPLDGTSNFVAVRDYFAICAAYIEDEEVKAAVIADPMRDKLVKAAKGEGAFLQTSYGTCKKLDISTCEDNLKQMQLECEIPFNSADDMMQISPLMSHVSGFRKSGSTALDILNMVCGRKIICLSSNLAPFDIAAAVLIVQEAGGIITDMRGSSAKYNTDNIVTAAPRAHAQIMRSLNP